LLAGAGAPADEKAQAVAGAALYRQQDCAHCHGEALEGAKKGPALANLWQDAAWTPEKITSQILNGGQKMPPFGDSLTDEQIAQLVAFLKARERPPVPPAAQ
jgi:mono/diheme cytochrome c family protein